MNDITSPAAVASAAETDDAKTAIVSIYQKQKKIYVRAVSGGFAAWRWGLVWVTQLLFYGLPWLDWNARQAVLFDLSTRRFYVFGLVLYPQDFIFLTGLLIVSAYALFLFTAVAGRLWCGYACPQTVYTAVLVLICVGLGVGLLLRSPVRVDVVRDRGALARIVDDGWVENVYRLQLMNTTERVQHYRITAGGLDQVAQDLKGAVMLAGAEARWVALAVKVPPGVAAQMGSGSHPLTFEVQVLEDPAQVPQHRELEKSTFLVPR